MVRLVNAAINAAPQMLNEGAKQAPVDAADREVSVEQDFGVPHPAYLPRGRCDEAAFGAMGERGAGRFGESPDEAACPSDTRGAGQFRGRRPSFQEYNGTNGMVAKHLFRQRGWASGGSKGIACGSWHSRG